MNKFILTLVLLFSFNLFAQQSSPENKELAKQVYEIIEDKGQDYVFEGEAADLFLKLNRNLRLEVIKDFEREAGARGLSRDEYPNSNASMDKFATDLEHTVETMDSLTDAEVFLLTMKVGIRFQFHNSGRFLPSDFQRNTKRAQKSIVKLAARLKIAL